MATSLPALSTLSLHDALPICDPAPGIRRVPVDLLYRQHDGDPPPELRMVRPHPLFAPLRVHPRSFVVPPRDRSRGAVERHLDDLPTRDLFKRTILILCDSTSRKGPRSSRKSR